jgi:hypothetical protein
MMDFIEQEDGLSNGRRNNQHLEHSLHIVRDTGVNNDIPPDRWLRHILFVLRAEPKLKIPADFSRASTSV